MDEVVLGSGVEDEVVTAPSQLLLLDRKATTLLAKLLVNPNRDPASLVSAEELASRVLGLVARLNSREALVACVVCALVASDDCTLRRGIEIETAICDFIDIVARIKREPAPRFPPWLKIAQQLLAEEKNAKDDEANAAMRGKFQASVADVSNGPTLSKAQASLVEKEK
jgi:hypothetical protein